MSIQIVIDMNLSPDWVNELSKHGWAAVHWSTIGDPRATDLEIMGWARANAHVVFTHDLDFGTMLALTHASGPSVIQVRGQDVLPDHMAPTVLAALTQHQTDLAGGGRRIEISRAGTAHLTRAQQPSANNRMHATGLPCAKWNVVCPARDPERLLNQEFGDTQDNGLL